MKCYRCGGVMVYEKFYGACEFFLGWRRIFCGEIVEQVILEKSTSSQGSQTVIVNTGATPEAIFLRTIFRDSPLSNHLK